MKPVMRVLVLTVSLTASITWGQDAGWPRVVKDGGTQIVVYQPQPDSLSGVTLQSRVAVSIKRAEDRAPLFGALWVTANLDVSRDRDLARIASIKVDRTRFPDVPDSDVQSLVQFLQAEAPLWNLSISLTRLKASLQPVGRGPDADFRNDPPKIIVVDHPAILLLLDGEPRLQDAGTGLQQVVNTALPVIFDSRTGQYWFDGSSVWFTTNDLLHGRWTPADRAPTNIANLVQDTDTLDAAQTDAGTAVSPAQLRAATIVVSTEPAELIVTEGAPRYSPLVGGEILYVTNSESDIFLEVSTQRHYIVISGRWFAGPWMQGPWTFVAPENLPRAFANIPENSPKAGVLAFVPGTERAKDALMDNVIPQTAEVSRKDAKIDVQYDGAPHFAPIPNTSLAYAENTPSQVIRSNGKYYACEEGVWFVASSPSGPWAVSGVRPAGIDGIPPSSPVFNTKYVYIYDSTPDVVYVGYLPGYRWSLPWHGVVYYGTGWRYRGWFGRYYYPRPATWGFYARYNPWVGWNFGMSWTAGWLGLTSHWGYGWAGWMPVHAPGYRPGFWSRSHAGGWFGPGGYRPPRPPSWHPPGRPAPGRAGIRPPRPVGGPGNNLYTRPGNSGVRPRPGTLPGRPATGPRPGQPQIQPGDSGAGRPGVGRPGGRGPDGGGPGVGRPGGRGPDGGVPGVGRPGGRGPDGGAPGVGGRGSRPPEPPNPVTRPYTKRPDNVLTDRDGNVHRNNGGNWQTRQNQTLKPEWTPAPSRPADPSVRPAPQQPPPAQRPPSRPAIQTEPRGRGSLEAESGARNRGAGPAPQVRERKRSTVKQGDSK
jgi:hypothetical protein